MATIYKRKTRDGVRYQAIVRRKGMAKVYAMFPSQEAAETWAAETEAMIIAVRRCGDANVFGLLDALGKSMGLDMPEVMREAIVLLAERQGVFNNR